MTERKYSVASIGPRIDGFLKATLQAGGFDLNYEIQEAEPGDGDFETPDLVVKFTGPDVDALLSNRAELLLALEHPAASLGDVGAATGAALVALAVHYLSTKHSDRAGAVVWAAADDGERRAVALERA